MAPSPLERMFPAALAGGSGLQASPFQFWVTGEDHLALHVSNIVVASRIAVSGRFLEQKTGKIQAFQHFFTPSEDGIDAPQFYQLGVGALLNVVVEEANAVVVPGEIFVRLDIVRGFTGARVSLGTLISGYVGSWGGRAWPGSPLEQPGSGQGRVRLVQSSVPAAGANATLNMPAMRFWRLMSATATLTTSAVVNTRRAHLAVDYAGAVLFASRSTLGHPASSNFRHWWGAGLSAEPTGAVDIGEGSLPVDFLLQTFGSSIATIRTSTSLIDAGDQWTALSILVEEWLNPLLSYGI